MSDELSKYKDEWEFYIGAISKLPEMTQESMREYVINNNLFPTGPVPEEELEEICEKAYKEMEDNDLIEKLKTKD